MNARGLVVIVCWSLVAGRWSLVFAAYDPHGRRDPFVALVTPEGALVQPTTPMAKKAASSEEPLVLDGIIYDARGQSIAVINGEVVAQGDVRGNLEVVAIEPSRVVVLRDGREEELRMPVMEPAEGVE